MPAQNIELEQNAPVDMTEETEGIADVSFQNLSPVSKVKNFQVAMYSGEESEKECNIPIFGIHCQNGCLNLNCCDAEMD